MKEIEVSHRIIVDDIILPKNAANFEEARRLAKRKGTVERKSRSLSEMRRGGE